MNKKTVLDMLRDILYTVLAHVELLGELTSLIAGSGVEMKFITLLVARLQALASHGVHATVMQEFESLRGSSGLYSMHLSGKGFNIRVLYGFLPNGQPVLLRAFHEQGGKKKTDYSSHIPVASLRLEEMRKDFENEN